MLDALLAKFSTAHATIGVVGLGYVGLPLVRALHAAGFRVIGFDIDASKIEKLTKGEAYLKHLGDTLVRELAASDRFTPTSDPSALVVCDAICICVPTPLGHHKDPDLSYVESSTRMIANVLRTRAAGLTLISLESTTYPGTTREVCKSILDAAGLALGRDYLLCFSPEREDPGRQGVDTSTIPRLVGGVDDASTRAGVAMYSRAVKQVIPVASAEVAEAAKLVENIYRSVNIALVNELKPVFATMGIDIWQVLDAAATKPFGFQRFSPGPGLGGHCIPIDPYYLTWKAREFGHATRFIELAGEINSAMPHYVVDRVAHALNDDRKPMRGSRVLVLGIAYKPDVDDIRETPAAEIIELLQSRGCDVSYHDPHVPEFPSMRKYQISLASVPLSAATLANVDCVVIVTDHRTIDWTLVGQHARLVVDSRNAMSRAQAPKARIVKA
ncbi:MAG TPA: nucleotide sugar dehydrogenase [Phycisphaerales bacterium]|nr:nucleotide sugar dehydrogenase [Phycisphaerales bacterium]